LNHACRDHVRARSPSWKDRQMRMMMMQRGNEIRSRKIDPETIRSRILISTQRQRYLRPLSRKITSSKNKTLKERVRNYTDRMD